MMIELSKDHTFHYELLRLLGTARDLGADVAEVLNVAGRIKPGNFDSWSTEFEGLGNRVRSQAHEQARRGNAISARNAYFRAAGYFRAADFFLHGNPRDPRIVSLWNTATSCFDAALERLDISSRRILIKTDGFDIPAIFYAAGGNTRVPRPTVLMCNGYDGSQEEMFHVSGLAACARGYNVVTFEGPGQPTVIRDQGLTFIDEWEKVLSPVIDWCEMQPGIDASRIGVMGYSFGGWLVARAAAREHRIAALTCVDGILDAGTAFLNVLPPPLQQFFKKGDYCALNAATRQLMTQHTNMRWAVEHGCWVFGCATPAAFLERVQSMALSDIVGDIQCPVLVCDADDDAFFKGQPAALANALGGRATHQIFTDADSASSHCHVGANDLLNSTLFEWFGIELEKSRFRSQRVRAPLFPYTGEGGSYRAPLYFG
jgi:dienelactone hydrolase